MLIINLKSTLRNAFEAFEGLGTCCTGDSDNAQMFVLILLFSQKKFKKLKAKTKTWDKNNLFLITVNSRRRRVVSSANDEFISASKCCAPCTF